VIFWALCLERFKMNKEYNYTLIVSSITVEDQQYDSYGIACKEKDKLVKCVEDISVDEQKVENLVKLMNKLKLDPIQLEEVIEDSIS